MPHSLHAATDDLNVNPVRQCGKNDPSGHSGRTTASAQARELKRALAALRAGELVVYPTETFYGLGADALSPLALERLFQAKGREPGKPIALIAADAQMAFAMAREVPELAYRLARRFWPGPLTLVLPAREGLAPELIGPGGGVGVRVSSHLLALRLARGLGRPITATSANLAGQAPPSRLAEARRAFEDKVKVFLEGGKLRAAKPSTVVAVAPRTLTIIREGALPAAAITSVLA